MPTSRTRRLTTLAVLLLAGAAAAPAPAAVDGRTIEQRYPPPPGYVRLDQLPGSFGHWLRQRPLRPGRPGRRQYNGRLCHNQRRHEAVLDMDIGRRDLQQCADTVIRLRAEYLRDRGCDEDIAFRFTSGDLARWSDWRRGLRPRVRGQEVRWIRAADPDDGEGSFRRYLETVYSYAGTASLERELERVAEPADIQPGDVFIRGGFPGHAMIVADVAENAAGERIFLLVQGFMPAQDVHVVRSRDALSPWHREPPGEEYFGRGLGYRNLRRFPAAACEHVPVASAFLPFDGEPATR